MILNKNIAFINPKTYFQAFDVILQRRGGVLENQSSSALRERTGSGSNVTTPYRRYQSPPDPATLAAKSEPRLSGTSTSETSVTATLSRASYKEILDTIYCPFPPEKSPFQGDLPEGERSFAEKFAFFERGSDLENHFFKAKFYNLVSGAYPKASTSAKLQIANDFVDWLFVHDDFRELAAKALTPTQIEQFNNILQEILTGNRNPNSAHTLFEPTDLQKVALQKAFFNIYQRISSGDIGYIVKGVQQYFQANKWEAQNRQNATIPARNEFLDNRRHTSAVGACIALDYFVQTDGENPEKAISNNVFLEGMVAKAIDVVGLVNDVYSFKKEIQEGIVENNVTVTFLHKLADKVPDLKKIFFDNENANVVPLRKALIQFIFELLQGKEPTLPISLDSSSQALFDTLSKQILAQPYQELLDQSFAETVSLINDLTRTYESQKKLAPAGRVKDILADCCENWMKSNLDWSRNTYRYA